MRKAFFQVAYIVLSAAALIVAAGAPIPWSGSGGGNGMTGIGVALSAIIGAGGPF
jgi:hypothetical protein